MRRQKLLLTLGLPGLTMIAAAVHAQTAGSQAEDLNEVVVTGIRGSLIEAISIKRESDVISDVISAEDIGKFPDQNLAESLQRITGVAITRYNGEGQFVSVRGLDPSFTRMQYNGRSVTSPIGSRSFDFTIISSDFVQSIEAYKTPTADQIDGGIAATINVTSAKPLNLGKNTFVVSAEGILEDNASEVAPHFVALGNWVNSDSTFGATLGVNYEQRTFQNERYQAFGLENGQETTGDTTNPGANSALKDYNLDGDTLDSFRFNHGGGFQVNAGTNERKTVVAGLQWKPNDNFEVYWDGLYSHFEEDFSDIPNIHRFTYIWDANIPGQPAGIVGSVIEQFPDAPFSNATAPGGVLMFMDADGVDHRNNVRDIHNRHETFSTALGAKFQATDNVEIRTEYSFSKSERRDTNVGLEALGRASVSQDLRNDTADIPEFEYQRGYDPLDASNFNVVGFNGGYNWPTNDKNADVRLDVKWTQGDAGFTSMQFGAMYSDRTHDIGTNFLSVSAQQLATELGVPYSATIENGSFNAADYMREYSFSGMLSAYGGSNAVPTRWLATNNAAVLSQVSVAELAQIAPPIHFLNNEFVVSEAVSSAYLRQNFSFMDDRLTGNVGLRYVRTSQDSEGWLPDFSEIIYSQQGATTIIPNSTQQTISRSYNETLPSLNIKYSLTDDMLVRFAAAKVMARPDLGRLSPATSIDANVRTINSNNPYLNPYLATQFDLSFEWYFSEGSLLSFAIFRKDIDNFIVSAQSTEVLTVQNESGGGTTDLTFTRNAPANGADGMLQGVEAGVQLPFSFLPGVWKNFGILANYTYLDSDPVRTVAGGPELPLPGVSDNSYNLVGYFENEKFGIRAAYNYRSDYVVSHFNAFGDGAYALDFGQLDLSANYNINDHLSLSFSGVNLLEEAGQQVNSIGISEVFVDTGRRFALALRASF